MTTMGTYNKVTYGCFYHNRIYTREGKVSITCYMNIIDNKFVTRKCLYLYLKFFSLGLVWKNNSKINNNKKKKKEKKKKSIRYTIFVNLHSLTCTCLAIKNGLLD